MTPYRMEARCVLIYLKNLALISGLMAGIVIAGDAAGSTQSTPAPLDNSGPLKLKFAAQFGGAAKDSFIGAEILSNGVICLAGNGVDFTPPGVVAQFGTNPTTITTTNNEKSKSRYPQGSFGFVFCVAPDGSSVVCSARLGSGVVIHRLQIDAKDRIHLLAEAAGEIDFGAGQSKVKGVFLLTLASDGKQIVGVLPRPDATDFALDSNGDVVFLASKKLVRVGVDGKEKWAATWKTYGDNRPGGFAVCPKTGVVCVTGYGMTHTGKEPYKDPYAYGFDRAGKEIWMLWNPDPKKEKDVKFSAPELKTNGLMADTTGRAVTAAGDGTFQVMLYADGGNSVCTRNPLDVDAPLDPQVHQGAYQKGPGHGFKGASKTSVVFRVNAQTGALEKGTWMCAWLTPQRANGLQISDAARDGEFIFVAGGSASGCPTDKPWFKAPSGELAKGAYLAVFNSNYGMQQCGSFPSAQTDHVAARNGTVVLAGSTRSIEGVPQLGLPAPAFKTQAGGDSDAFFAVFKLEK